MADIDLKAGVPAFAPFVPPVIKEGMLRMLKDGSSPLAAATAGRRSFREGKWAKKTVKVGKRQFGFAHNEGWTLAHWTALAEKLKVSLEAPPKKERPAPPEEEQLPEEERLKVVASVIREQEHAKLLKKEARERARLDEEPPEETDSKKDLELLRRALRARLTIAEQADILVQLARGDNAGVAKGALDQIRDVLGMKAANVPEAPGIGSIFILPEGAGPAIR